MGIEHIFPVRRRRGGSQWSRITGGVSVELCRQKNTCAIREPVHRECSSTGCMPELNIGAVIPWGLCSTWLGPTTGVRVKWAINNEVLPTTALRLDEGPFCAINFARRVIFARPRI